jgi:hypothetical protein
MTVSESDGADCPNVADMPSVVRSLLRELPHLLRGACGPGGEGTGTDQVGARTCGAGRRLHRDYRPSDRTPLLFDGGTERPGEPTSDLLEADS